MFNILPAIMLSRIKIGLPEIRRALLELDDMKLSIDDLRAIGKQLPTSEEVYQLCSLIPYDLGPHLVFVLF